MKTTERTGSTGDDSPVLTLKNEYIALKQRHAIELGNLAENASQMVRDSTDAEEKELLKFWRRDISDDSDKTNSQVKEIIFRSALPGLRVVR